MKAKRYQTLHPKNPGRSGVGFERFWEVFGGVCQNRAQDPQYWPSGLVACAPALVDQPDNISKCILKVAGWINPLKPLRRAVATPRRGERRINRIRASCCCTLLWQRRRGVSGGLIGCARAMLLAGDERQRLHAAVAALRRGDRRDARHAAGPLWQRPRGASGER